MDQEAFEMGIAIGLAGAVMTVIAPEGSEGFQPLVDIGDQAVLGVVDPDAGGNVHGGNQNHAFADSALFEHRFYLRSNIEVLSMFRSLKRQILSVESHTAMIHPD